MTLVELLVFMSLTLSLMGGTMAVLRQGNAMDASAEERLAAGFSCISTLAELNATPFEDLVDEDSEFEELDNGNFKKIRASMNFHTKGGLNPAEMYAKEVIVLRPGTTGDSPQYYATVTLQWNSSSRLGATKKIQERVSTIIYP